MGIMSNTVVSVENLSKVYRLGQIGTGTFSRDLELWWAKARGKPNPFLKIGQADRGSRDGEEIWALRDVSFTVEQGEVLGIIGRNGAGKSTLLKILSRVTAPTFGQVKAKGRIASLLEVGTGFHPELTGRENIYLNGAILGMSKGEVARKFDEIVAFAEIEKFIDTPVKRYSSGMYVRLAFAVAAHLEPEILLVDEVLAVGDAAFQKKCLGKMGDVAKGGRTVLFVSHNMTAIRGLCQQCIHLNGGEIKRIGDSETVISHYLVNRSVDLASRTWQNHNAPAKYGVHPMLVAVEIPDNKYGAITTRTPVKTRFRFWSGILSADLNICVFLKTVDSVIVLNTVSEPRHWPQGIVEGSFVIPAGLLNEGVYLLRVAVIKNGWQTLLDLDDVVSFEVHDESERSNWYGKWPGVIHPEFAWDMTWISEEQLRQYSSTQNRNKA